ncbi:MAG: PAS domain S-box protein, partial [Bacteroidetes bacterium]|nr:PAS domain S-box protein [Bacteroidota bacterium]
WFGTGSGGLNRFDPKTRSFSHFLPRQNNSATLPNAYITALMEDSSGNFWVGSSGGILSLFSRSSGKVIKNYKNNPEDPLSITSSAQVKFIIEDQDNADVLWIATINGGVEKFNIPTEEFIHYKNDKDNPDSLSINSAVSLYDDGKGNIWVATYGGGLDILDKKTGIFKHHTHDLKNPASINSNTLYDIYKDSQGGIWISGKGGISLLENRDGKFINITKSSGLDSEIITAILEDNNQNLWLGTINKGIIQFNPKTKKFRNYTKKDGLPGNSIFWNSRAKTRDGKLWFGGKNGAFSFHPEEIKSNPNSPEIFLTSFKQGGKEVLLDKAPEIIEVITLDWDENFFEFQFAALNFSKSQKNQYAYKLEGRDTDWYSSGNQPFGRYTGLKGGTYLLKLKGSNNDGLWNKKETSIKIIVKSPFWRTQWFYSIMICLCLTMLGFILIYLRKLRREINDRKQAEESLRKSEETFRAIVEHVPVMIDSFDENGKCLIWNKEVENRLGFNISEVNESENTLELFYSKKEAQEIIKNISRKDGKFRLFHPVAKNGEIKTQEWADFALPDGRSVSIGMDITDRRLAEKKFKTAFYSNAALMAISTIEEGRFIEVNDKFVEITEYAREVIIGKTSKELNLFIDFSDRANFKEKVETTGKGPHKEIRIRTKSGSIRYGYFSASIVSLETDEKAMLTVMVDLTETRKMKNALQESEEKYHDIYDNAPDMYVSVDAKTNRIIECNQTLSDATGYTKDEIIGQPIFFVYHPDAIESAKDAFQEFVVTGEIKGRELILKRKDGSKIDVLLKVTSIEDNEGNVLHSISSWRDITELKQAEATIKKREEELQQAQKMESIGNLAGGIAHDFNNLLFPILGMSEMLLEDLPQDSLEYENAQEIFIAGKRAGALVQQILAFS